MNTTIPTPSELAEMMRFKHAFLRQRNLALPVEQRMAKFWKLHERSMEILKGNPEGYARFMRRNLKARAIPPPPGVEIPEWHGEIRDAAGWCAEETLRVLLRHHVPFVIIGGVAVNLYDETRNTEDTDIVFQRTPESEKALLAALHELNACWVMADKAEPGGVRLVPVTESYVARTRLMMLVTDAGLLDLFDYIPGFPDEPVDSLFADCELSNGVRYVSLDWLKKMKHASDRPQDRLDLERLEGTP